MSCNCINAVTNIIRGKTGDPQATIDVSTSISLNEPVNSPASPRASREWPKMTYSYREKRRSGEFSKPHKGLLIPTYCPFCGKPYKDEEEGGEK